MAHALQHCMKWLLCSRNTTPKHRVPAPGMPWFLSDEFQHPILNAFCRKRKKYFKKKLKRSRRGDTLVQTHPNGGFLYFFFFKSNIKFSSANLLLKREKKINWRIWAENQTCVLQEFVFKWNRFYPRKQVSPLQPAWIPVNFPYALSCVAK